MNRRPVRIAAVRGTSSNLGDATIRVISLARNANSQNSGHGMVEEYQLKRSGVTLDHLHDPHLPVRCARNVAARVLLVVRDAGLGAALSCAKRVV